MPFSLVAQYTTFHLFVYEKPQNKFSSFDVEYHLVQHRSQVLSPIHLSRSIDGWERTLGTRLETPISFRATEKILRTTRGSPFPPFACSAPRPAFKQNMTTRACYPGQSCCASCSVDFWIMKFLDLSSRVLLSKEIVIILGQLFRCMSYGSVLGVVHDSSWAMGTSMSQDSTQSLSRSLSNMEDVPSSTAHLLAMKRNFFLHKNSSTMTRRQFSSVIVSSCRQRWRWKSLQ